VLGQMLATNSAEVSGKIGEGRGNSQVGKTQVATPFPHYSTDYRDHPEQLPRGE